MSVSIRMLVDTEKQASQINRSQYLVGGEIDRHVITKTIRELILINLLWWKLRIKSEDPDKFKNII